MRTTSFFSRVATRPRWKNFKICESMKCRARLAGGLGVPCTRNRLYAGATAGEGVSSLCFQAMRGPVRPCPPGPQVRPALPEGSVGALCHGNPVRPGREQRYRGLRALGGVRGRGTAWGLGQRSEHRPRCAWRFNAIVLVKKKQIHTVSVFHFHKYLRIFNVHRCVGVFIYSLSDILCHSEVI